MGRAGIGPGAWGLLLAACLPVPQGTTAPACMVPEQRLPLPQPAAATPPPPAPAGPGDYRNQLAPSPYGWVHLPRWCVWVEPVAAGDDAQGRRERLWLEAVETALGQWAAAATLVRTDQPEAAQVLIRRRLPPLRTGADGRPRASHGRATLTLLASRSGGISWLEPRVEVWIGPGQGPRGLQATALHELGHAFGLWGHSPERSDAMAAVPGALPVLSLSARDRATLRWLQAQPTAVGGPLSGPGPGERP